MKPIIIFQFIAHEGPGYLAEFLDTQAIEWQLVKVNEGDSLPASILAYSGVVLMGGPMSVNDDLPWIPPLLDLIREADKSAMPLLGHCLGGQLISKALGAIVSKNPVKEIGWGEVTVIASDEAKQWFGEIESFNSFHWHGETFSLPQGATHLLSSPYCTNQAYAIGQHLALQCHIEMTAEMVQKWCDEGVDELAEAQSSPAVQQADVMLQNVPLHCFFLNKVANQLYTQWIKGLQLN
ncbi:MULTISPECIES: type 1 glutamine amidotransferase [Methylotenera]|uniref:type 1 glutamine amidotransferase n=1 Tax=Methylotenera TaxID=359407 RepID=UPI0003738B92|nr:MULTISPECIES: type 1 glutamine amidotransferase [Methylotenera]